jgi:hypothetical protein
MKRSKLHLYLVLIALLAALFVLSCGGGSGGGDEPGDCNTNADCEITEYCETSAEDCEGVGECVTMPTACFDVWDPVCGCDGTTYGNACEAGAAGVSVAYSGVCIVDPGCSSNADCEATEYCETADGDCGSVGECLTMPAVCTTEDTPICGCDLTTYDNACFAAKAGVSVASTEECPTVSGCIDNADCEVTESCQKSEGDCGGVGECVAMPAACPNVWNPVCGCDDSTYSNACEAEAAGVSIAYSGQCIVDTGCSDNVDCEATEYCETADGDCASVGECVTMPAVCTTEDAPVCGCNLTTYDNECLAAAAGVSVASTEECPAVSGCIDNSDCEATEYCGKDLNNCGGVGVCETKPLLCLDVWDPECGCNGTTYGNACEAGAVGVSIASTGACPP